MAYKYSIEGLVGGSINTIISYVEQAMRECRYSEEQIKSYKKKATGGRYYDAVLTSRSQIQEVNNKVIIDNV